MSEMAKRAALRTTLGQYQTALSSMPPFASVPFMGRWMRDASYDIVVWPPEDWYKPRGAPPDPAIHYGAASGSYLAQLLTHPFPGTIQARDRSTGQLFRFKPRRSP